MVPHRHRVLGLTITAAGLAACSGPPADAGTAPFSEIEPSTFVYAVRSSISEERLIAASIRSVATAGGRDEGVALYLVEGTAAGTAPLVSLAVPDARNRYAEAAQRQEQAGRAEQRITAAMSATAPPAPGRADDLAQTVAVAILRAESESTAKRPFVVIITTALAPGEPPATIELPEPSAGRGAEVVIVGAGDFGGLARSVDPVISEEARRYAEGICDAVERSAAGRSCRVEPTLEADPTREPVA